MSELRRHRINNRLSVENLSEKSGVPVRTIYRIEKGETRRPNVEHLGALADALGVQPAEIDPELTREAV